MVNRIIIINYKFLLILYLINDHMKKSKGKVVDFSDLDEQNKT